MDRWVFLDSPMYVCVIGALHLADGGRHATRREDQHENMQLKLPNNRPTSNKSISV